MPTIATHTRPGTPDRENEDWYAATTDLTVVLDGATIRTETGCQHGLPWYVRQLGAAIMSASAELNRSLTNALAAAIKHVADLHRDTCDLDHPGTPSAAVGIVRRNHDRLEWLVLGDITVMVDTGADELTVTVDNRVSQTALAERAECNRYRIGDPDKPAVIRAMKDVELASRNVDGGYWIASVLPEAAQHAYTGSAVDNEVRRFAVCSDGVVRALDMTELTSHRAVFDVLRHRPALVVDQVRQAEQADPYGDRKPRNKATDDATVVYVELHSDPVHQLTDSEQDAALSSSPRAETARTGGDLFGAVPTRDGRVL